jgi:ArsR family metal-binding transcriptional regulator
MKTEDLNLTIHEYCVDDDTLTVQGKFPRPPDLPCLTEISRGISSKVILMKRLDLLYFTVDRATVHIHGNGEILVNSVKSIEEAEKILTRLMS